MFWKNNFWNYCYGYSYRYAQLTELGLNEVFVHYVLGITGVHFHDELAITAVILPQAR